MSKKIYVAGVGMTQFTKPGKSDSYDKMAVSAAASALADAGVTYEQIQQGYVGYVYADSTAGQKVLYQLGKTSIPIINVNNNCATGSTALYLARQAIASDEVDCVLVVGFEQMKPGAIGEVFSDIPSPFAEFDRITERLIDHNELPVALRYFGGAGESHMKKFGTPIEAFAKIRAKASRHGKNNPLAVLRDELTVDQVLAAPVLWPGVLTRYMACPPTCGAAAAVLVSEKFAIEHQLDRHVQILAQAMTTDGPETFTSNDMMDVVGYSMAQRAAQQVYESAGIGPDELDLVELHDCFAQNELISYEALGLCAEGTATDFIDAGDNTYGGKIVTNPSGGLLSKGHPLGATGLAQCYEITHQLRHSADQRQVLHARTALQHNLGIGGACVVTMYQRNEN